jgi:hypothetical protein
MRKGKFNICLAYFAVFAFLLAILGQTLACCLVMFAAIFLEKDEWLGRQTIQAFALLLVGNVVTSVLGMISSFFSFLPFGIFNPISSLFSGLNTFVSIGIMILSILAILNCLKERDAGVPVISGLSYRVYGLVAPAPARAAPTYAPSAQSPINPVNPTPTAPPVNSVPPVNPINTAPPINPTDSQQ